MPGRRYLSSALIVAVALFAGCRDESTFEPPAPPAPESSAAAQEEFIPGQYIVVFKDDVGNPTRLANEIARANGLTLRHTYRYALRGFSAVVPEGRLAALERHPRVKSVRPNRLYHIDTHERLRGTAPSIAALAAFTAPPEGLDATAVSSSQIDLTWVDASDNEVGFEIDRAPSPDGPFAKVDNVKAGVTAFSDSSLEPNTQYCYRVRAVSGRGKNAEYSDYSNVTCQTTQDGSPPPPPPADNRPSELTAAPATSTRIDLAWTDNWDGETGFEIERCEPASPGAGCSDFTLLTTVGADVTAYGDNGLWSGDEYCYQVRAYKKKGKKYEYTEYTNVACAQPQPEPPPVPPDAAPNYLTATAVSSSAIDLIWLDNSSNEDGFEIERHAGDGNFAKVAETGPGATSYGDTGLQASTTYTYRVRAFNAAGFSDYSNSDVATTNDQPPPSQCADTGNHDDVTQLWNIERLKAHLNPKWQATQQAGCEMKAWFFGLDSGVDSDHPDLNVVETVDFVGDGSFGEDGNGHGTHTAGTAAAVDGNGNAVGVAPGAPIYGFKVCDDAGQCPEDVVLRGIDEVTARKQANPGQPMVANMSLGGIGTDDVMETAVRRSINAGVVYSLSAGNGMIGICLIPYDSQDHTPSRVGDDDINSTHGSDGDTQRTNGAITVTSHDQNNADYDCNYGNPVTVAAPGVGVISTWLNGTYANLTGTSMAAPHAAGAAILYLQDHPNATPEQVEQAIMSLLAPWTTDESPNAGGRLEVDKL
jgi:subtilisin family serine protease